MIDLFVCLFFAVADAVGKAKTATSAWCIRAASTATATARRGSASATPIGAASSAIKVGRSLGSRPPELGKPPPSLLLFRCRAAFRPSWVRRPPWWGRDPPVRELLLCWFLPICRLDIFLFLFVFFLGPPDAVGADVIGQGPSCDRCRFITPENKHRNGKIVEDDPISRAGVSVARHFQNKKKPPVAREKKTKKKRVPFSLVNVDSFFFHFSFDFDRSIGTVVVEI